MPPSQLIEISLGDSADIAARGLLPADRCLGLGNSVTAGAAASIELHEGVAALLVESASETFGGACPGQIGGR